MDHDDAYDQIYHRSKSNFRWAIVLLCSCALFGCLYCYDNPTALATQIQNTYTLSDIQYNLLYSVYSFPNIVLPLFGGALVDKIGAKAALLIFLCFITTGQALFTFAAYIRSYPFMILSRVVYGLGGESLGISQFSLLALYFEGDKMAFAMGLSLSLGRLGSVLNDFATLKIYKIHNSIPQALGAGFLLLCICLFTAIIITSLDKCIATQKSKQGFLVPEAHHGDVVKLSDVKAFSLLYWLLLVSCVVVYGCVLPWNNIGSAFMQNTYHMTAKQGNNHLLIPYLICAFCVPLFGYISDKIGKRSQLIALSTIALTASHCIFTWFTCVNALIPLCLMGVSYSIYASAIWPSVAMIVKQSRLGTAYGFIGSVQNGGLALIPIIVGSLTLNDDQIDATTYYYVEIFFFGLGCFGVVIGLAVWYLDTATTAGLSEPSIQKIHETIGKNASLIKDNASLNDVQNVAIQ
eukprot:801681_1